MIKIASVASFVSFHHLWLTKGGIKIVFPSDKDTFLPPTSPSVVPYIDTISIGKGAAYSLASSLTLSSGSTLYQAVRKTMYSVLN